MQKKEGQSSFIMHPSPPNKSWLRIWHAFEKQWVTPFVSTPFSFSPSYTLSSHLQIMKAIILPNPFLWLGEASTVCIFACKPHKIWANAFNKLSQDNAWKVVYSTTRLQTKILCALPRTKVYWKATKYAEKSGEIGVLLDIMSLSAVFFDVFTNKSNFLRFQFQSCYF